MSRVYQIHVCRYTIDKKNGDAGARGKVVGRGRASGAQVKGQGGRYTSNTMIRIIAIIMNIFSRLLST